MKTLLQVVEDKYFVAPDGCWLWLGSIDRDGYGNAKTRYGRAAHRLTYQAYVGDIPEGMQLDHLCRQRSCVNPYHLEPVTQQENILRGSLTKKICEHGNPHSRCELGCKTVYKRERYRLMYGKTGAWRK